ncbi:MAG: hypothetical protein JW774_13810 [Candidatus Aureabacteria bacterium]|nr:hypothetical protein [Candidatus Auribacterota bacterium]
MFSFFIITGLLTLVISIVLLFFPRFLYMLNAKANAILFTDEKAFYYRKIAGVFLIIFALVLFVLAFNFN